MVTEGQDSRGDFQCHVPEYWAEDLQIRMLSSYECQSALSRI
ncbi:hypothetical protein PRBEI_2001210900 [Prionailurus iriomotensis]